MRWILKMLKSDQNGIEMHRQTHRCAHESWWLKSDQNGIEISLVGYVAVVVLLKSDQNGIEIFRSSFTNFVYALLKADQNGIEIEEDVCYFGFCVG